MILYLAATCWLTAYAGEGNAEISAYLAIVHKSNWERRVGALHKGRRESLNKILATIYFGASLIAYGSALYRIGPPSWENWKALEIAPLTVALLVFFVPGFRLSRGLSEEAKKRLRSRWLEIIRKDSAPPQEGSPR